MIESMVISLLFPCFMRCPTLCGGFLSQPVKRQKERRNKVSHPLSDQLMVGMLCWMVSCPYSFPSNHITSTSHLNYVCEAALSVLLQFAHPLSNVLSMGLITCGYKRRGSFKICCF